MCCHPNSISVSINSSAIVPTKNPIPKSTATKKISLNLLFETSNITNEK